MFAKQQKPLKHRSLLLAPLPPPNPENNEYGEFTVDYTGAFIENASKFTSEFNHEGVRALEIGSQEGRSAKWITKNFVHAKNSTLDCVDVWEETAEFSANEEVGFAERFKRNLKTEI